MKNRLFFKIFSTGLNFILSIIIGVLVPRAIGPLYYGDFSYIVSTYSFLFQFLMFSTGTAYIFFISQKKYNIAYLNFIYLLFLFLIYFIVFLIVFITIHSDFSIKYLWNGLSDKYLLYLGFIFGILTNLQQSFILFSDSTAQTILSEKVILFSKIVLVIIIIYFIYENSLNIYRYFILLIFTLILFFILFFKYISFDIKLVDKREFIVIVNDFFHYLKPLIFFTLIASIYSYLGKYILQATSGSLEQGYYTFAFQLALIPVTFLSSIMAIYMSEMTKKFQNKDIQGVREIFLEHIFKIYTIHLFLSCFMLINAKDIILITVGTDYLGATEALQGLTIFSLFHTFGMFSRNIFLSSGRTREYSIINALFMLLGIVYLIYILLGHYILTAMHLSIIMACFYVLRVLVQLYFNFNFLKIDKMAFVLELIFITLIVFFVLAGVNLMDYNIFGNLLLSMVVLVVINYLFDDYIEFQKLIKRS